MKKSILFLAIFVSLVNAVVYSQEDSDERQYLISGSFNATIQENYLPLSSITTGPFFGSYSTNTNKMKYSTLTISPTVSKIVNKHLNVGLYGSTMITNSNITSNNGAGATKRKSNRYTAGFISRYIVNPDNQFNFHLSPYVGFSVADENYSSASGSSTINDISVRLFEVGIRPGLIYNLNEKFRLLLNTGNLSYINGSSAAAEAEETYKFQALALNFSISSFLFGVEYKF